jgi:TonB family protein
MKCLTFLLACSLGAAASARGDDSLTAARELYVSAAYEEALAMLTRLRGAEDSGGAQSALQIDEYRALCLYALGRTGEAESAAQALIRKDPFFQLATDDISPRVESMFAAVRRQLLPVLIREKYRAAKTTIDRKAFDAAQPQLGLVRHLIDQADALGINDETIADIGVLTDGFLDLVRASSSGTAASTETPTGTPPGTAGSDAAGRTASRVASPTAVGAPATVSAMPGSAVNGSDSREGEVFPPVTVRQRLPPIPEPMLVVLKSTNRRHGRLEVTIEPDGHVSDAVIVESVNPAYDSMVVQAARQWRYRPATRNGTPIRFVKTIALDLQPQP